MFIACIPLSLCEDKINSIISSTDGSKHIGALDPKITRNVIGSSTTCS